MHLSALGRSESLSSLRCNQLVFLLHYAIWILRPKRKLSIISKFMDCYPINLAALLAVDGSLNQNEGIAC